MNSVAAKVYLGLGSNMGDRVQNLKRSLKMLSENARIEKLSSIYETEPVGFTEQPLFLNAVCLISTVLSPRELLKALKNIESNLGRTPSFPNAPRPIDLDILFYDNRIIDSQELTIPHPRINQRAFVLVPLAEIDPDFTHPRSGKTIKELLSIVDYSRGVHKMFEADKIMD
jgi:2-amino-4-hydroxy-6-hydroxymethyldihydropteridine diphosphokinase